MSTPQAVYTHDGVTDGGVDAVGVGGRVDVTAWPALCRSVVVCVGGVNPVAEKRLFFIITIPYYALRHAVLFTLVNTRKPLQQEKHCRIQL